MVALAKSDPEMELAQEMARFEGDPLGFVLFAFPWGMQGTPLATETGPREWQRQVLVEIGKHIQSGKSYDEAFRLARSSGHGIGKSALVAWLILWSLSTCVDARAIVTANTEAQLENKTWPELGKWHRMAINSHWFKFNATSLHARDAKHEKTWRADSIPWSEHRSEAFAGLHNKDKRVLLIFDEASAIADKIWEVAEGALTDAATEILWFAFGNPTRNTGRFYNCFHRLRHRWRHAKIDSRKVEGTNKSQLDQWVADYGEDSDFVKVRVKGEFPSQSLLQFIPEDIVKAAMERQLQPSQYCFAPKVIGVDPAWTGDDPLEIYLRQGLKLTHLKSVPKNDNDFEIAQMIANFEDVHQADAVFVDGGFGTGIVSAGKTMNRGWQIVWFSEKPGCDDCVNKRAEMWKLSKEWLKEGADIPDDDDLRSEATSVEQKWTKDGKILLESKKEMRDRGEASPNKWDAVALTFARPVVRKARELAAAAYDPLDPFTRSDETEYAEHGGFYAGG